MRQGRNSLERIRKTLPSELTTEIAKRALESQKKQLHEKTNIPKYLFHFIETKLPYYFVIYKNMLKKQVFSEFIIGYIEDYSNIFTNTVRNIPANFEQKVVVAALTNSSRTLRNHLRFIHIRLREAGRTAFRAADLNFQEIMRQWMDTLDHAKITTTNEHIARLFEATTKAHHSDLANVLWQTYGHQISSAREEINMDFDAQSFFATSYNLNLHITEQGLFSFSWTSLSGDNQVSEETVKFEIPEDILIFERLFKLAIDHLAKQIHANEEDAAALKKLDSLFMNINKLTSTELKPPPPHMKSDQTFLAQLEKMGKIKDSLTQTKMQNLGL